jgi:cytochrome P450
VSTPKSSDPSLRQPFISARITFPIEADWEDVTGLLTCQNFEELVKHAIASSMRLSRNALEAPQSEISQAGTKKRSLVEEALIQEIQDKKKLRSQCLNLLLAGRDMTACLLTWTLRLLVRHPRVLEKLRAEVQSITGLGDDAHQPSRADLKSMRYLNLVLQEVLRLYPSVPINNRTALKTTTFPVGEGPDCQLPMLLKKGEAVGYCVYAMHRCKDIYGEDALGFRPERWEDGKLLHDVGYGYLPFNAGPRA